MAGEKILDIDDSPTVQRLIEMILSSQGYEVVLASDGEEGIAKARSERPAAILVDFVMPKMNGFQVCKTLKDDPSFKDTPIILVTSKGDKIGSKFVKTLGITEYFTKPFQPEELLAKIREVIDNRNASPMLVQEPASEVPSEIIQELYREAEPEPQPSSPSGAPSAAGDIEAMVRTIVEQALGAFVRDILPDLIRKELARQQQAEGESLFGSLATVRMVEVLQTLGRERQTGKLIVTRSGDAVEVYFRDGSVVFASSNSGGDDPVDGLLRKTCRIGNVGIENAKRIASMTGQPIDRVLIQERMIDSRAFALCLKRHTESAVFKIMAWKEGAFSFEKADPPPFASGLQLKAEDLLIEGTRGSE